MKETIQQLDFNNFPPLLKEITDPPEKLFYKGRVPNWQKYKLITFVGSRKYSSYGKQVCEKLIKGLAGTPVIVVSGLAYGIDSIAHREALKQNIKTIAFPGSGLHSSVIYPRGHTKLAKEILDAGGALFSEFPEKQKAAAWTFPQRNRLLAGISHITVVIEAEQRSGTLITARLATEYNRDLFAVPHDITRPTAKGSNNLIKEGAYTLTSSEDLLNALNIKPENKNNPKTEKYLNLSGIEKQIYKLLKSEPSTKDELIKNIQVEITQLNIAISTMEIKGIIKENLGKFYIL